MHKRSLLLALASASLSASLLGACGFRLRGVPQFAFGSLYIAAPAASPVARELTRTLQGSGGNLRVTREAAEMNQVQAVFELLSEQQERTVVALNSAGQVRELQLRLRIRFRLRDPQGDEIIAPTELLQTRDVSYNETVALAKEAEEALLMRNMQTDLVQQLMRRLAAARMAR